jgi:hypothetical protein
MNIYKIENLTLIFSIKKNIMYRLSTLSACIFAILLFLDILITNREHPWTSIKNAFWCGGLFLNLKLFFLLNLLVFIYFYIKMRASHSNLSIHTRSIQILNMWSLMLFFHWIKVDSLLWIWIVTNCMIF